MSGDRWADLVDAEADQRDGYTARLGNFERYGRCGAFIAPVRGLAAGAAAGAASASTAAASASTAAASASASVSAEAGTGADTDAGASMPLRRGDRDRKPKCIFDPSLVKRVKREEP